MQESFGEHRSTGESAGFLNEFAPAGSRISVLVATIHWAILLSFIFIRHCCPTKSVAGFETNPRFSYLLTKPNLLHIIKNLEYFQDSADLWTSCSRAEFPHKQISFQNLVKGNRDLLVPAGFVDCWISQNAFLSG